MVMDRRQLLVGTLGMAVVAALSTDPVWAAAKGKKEQGVPFSFEWLANHAKSLAGKDYEAPPETATDWLKQLGYDGYRDIRHRKEKAYWNDSRSPYRMEFFHMGGLFLSPVMMNEVVDGQSKAIVYNPELFSFGHLAPPEGALTEQLGYAGFRFHYPLNNPKVWDELFVFLGASYFRALGKDEIYGLSARGLAVDTAMGRGEEFPSFRSFWVERPKPGAKQATVWALLDSPSVTGAYRFVITPGPDTKMDVTVKLFTRKAIERIGIAPLTSMFAFGENENRLTHDFRPEVHDSDGLLLSQNKEWLWRPLRNPSKLSVSSFGVEKLGGFGLLQRDRNFDHYQDLEAHYERRPSLWVEPAGDWGKGQVSLIEIPTDSEIHDNIVAFWTPEKPVEAKQELNYAYRLSWGTAPAAKGRPWEVAATHVGNQFGRDVFKFVIDFAGDFPNSSKVTPQIDLWVGSGAVQGVGVTRNPHIKGWRVFFDFMPEDKATIVEMRCFLKANDKQVSETWAYQWSRES